MISRGAAEYEYHLYFPHQIMSIEITSHTSDLRVDTDDISMIYMAALTSNHRGIRTFIIALSSSSSKGGAGSIRTQGKHQRLTHRKTATLKATLVRYNSGGPTHAGFSNFAMLETLHYGEADETWMIM